jgi:hypothetical protein
MHIVFIFEDEDKNLFHTEKYEKSSSVGKKSVRAGFLSVATGSTSTLSEGI